MKYMAFATPAKSPTAPVYTGLFTYNDEPDQAKMQSKTHFTKHPLYCGI
jgi:hypothetical protein